MLNKTQFSDDFYEKLPKKPYCSDDLGVTPEFGENSTLRKLFEFF